MLVETMMPIVKKKISIFEFILIFFWIVYLSKEKVLSIHKIPVPEGDAPLMCNFLKKKNFKNN